MKHSRIHYTFISLLAAMFFLTSPNGSAAEEPGAFSGEKSTWHGFDRYDFFLDEQTMAIKPAPAAGEVAGQRRCIVVVPMEAAAGKPWSWRGCYWDHQPQSEIELLKRGFHIAYITADTNRKPDKLWDAWYTFLTEQHGLSKKPCFIGMSRGGEYEYTWATRNPTKVSCICADNPGANPEIFSNLPELARNDVPVLQICGSIDPLLGRNALVFESMYQQLGGRMSMMIKDGSGHHPHSLIDPTPIADFFVQSVQSTPGDPPAFVGQRFTKTSYYSNASIYREYPTEHTFITCRGPMFTDCYDRHVFSLPGVQGVITVIAPKSAAAGKPWVYRADWVGRDATVDQALLAQGFHIVTGPVSYNFDNVIAEDWNAVYKHLIENGFSKKPVMEGASGAAAAVYAWAIENPDKVSCIYAENPLLHSPAIKIKPLDNLSPLAKAAVPIFHACGSLDPNLESNTREAEKRYKELGGKFTVLVSEGQGHFPSSPKETQPVLDFIAASISAAGN